MHLTHVIEMIYRPFVASQIIKERQRGDELAADAGPDTPPPVEVRRSRDAGSRKRPFGSSGDGGATDSRVGSGGWETPEAAAEATAEAGPAGADAVQPTPPADSLNRDAAAQAPPAAAAADSPVADAGGSSPGGSAAGDADSQADGSGAGSEADSIARSDIGSAAAEQHGALGGRDFAASASAPVLLRFGAADDDPAAQLAAEESWAATLEVIVAASQKRICCRCCLWRHCNPDL